MRLASRYLVPGDVIVFSGHMMLVVSQDIPATTMPRPCNEGLCEPGLVEIAHQRDDRWVQTHWFTYAILKLQEQVTTNNSVRVQVPKRYGRFLDEHARKAYYQGA